MSNLNYQKGKKELENWLIEESVFDPRYLGKCESIFCQGNGYIGIRNALEESYVTETRNMFVAGTFNKFHETEVTELPNLPDITNITVLINKRPFSLTEGKILHYERTLNLKNGETVRKAEWESSQGERIRFTFSRVVSLADKHAVGMQVKITPLSKDAEIEIVSGIDGTVTNSGAQHLVEGDKRLYDGVYLEYLSETSESHIPVASYAAHRFFFEEGEAEIKFLPIIDRRQIKLSASLLVPENKTLVIEKTAAVYTGRDIEFSQKEDADKETLQNEIKEKGQAHIRSLREGGYEKLKRESETAWEQFWQEQDIIFETENPFDQLALRFALYHLNIMVNKEDNRTGIGAKALSGEGYKGHSFWDTEVFLLPYYLYTQPEIARNLLEYRYMGLTGAREKAKEYGYEGAMYPWEAAWIDDGEVTPLYGPADVVTGKPLKYWTGLIEQHISADITFAVWQYYLASGDEKFMNRCGYEMIFDTARFWLSRLEWNEEKKQYEINDVIGPDEYKEHVNNNVYTNYLAHYNILLADRLYDSLKETKDKEKAECFKRLEKMLSLAKMKEDVLQKADKLYLPKPDGQSGIIPQFDGYFDLEYLDITRFKESTEVLTIYKELSQEQINRYQIAKQGDLVVLLYLLEDLFDEETKQKNYSYYEERTLHDSSLSKSTHSIVASDLGMSGQAYAFYEGSCKVDLGEEMKSSDAGIHSASMGGIWQAAVQGFGGVRMAKDGLRIAPSLPKECRKLAFPLHYMGAALYVTVTPDKLTIENKGNTVSVKVRGRNTELKQRQTYEF